MENTQDASSRENLTDEIKELNSKITKNSSEQTKLNKSLTKLKAERTKLSNNLLKLMSDSSSADEIQAKYTELAQADTQLSNDLATIDNDVMTYQSQLLSTARSTGAQSAYYSNISNGYIQDGHVGKTAAQALNNAIGEIGTREATGHNDGAAVAKYRGGVDNGAAWCASFVSWCYKDNNVFGYQASVSGIRAKAQEKGLYSTVNSGYVPKAGDVMIQKENGASHTGIVESVDPDGTIHTIEGNASNMVRRVTYRVGSKGYNQISGFVRMSEGENA